MKPEFTEEQIKAIEEAISEAAKEQGGSLTVLNPKDVIAALTEPEFDPKIGQVYFNGEVGQYCASGRITPPALGGARPLNQTEVGPDWVPREVLDNVIGDLEATKNNTADDMVARNAIDILDNIPEEYRK